MQLRATTKRPKHSKRNVFRGWPQKNQLDTEATEANQEATEG